jgi:hypothetical protein
VEQGVRAVQKGYGGRREAAEDHGVLNPHTRVIVRSQNEHHFINPSTPHTPHHLVHQGCRVLSLSYHDDFFAYANHTTKFNGLRN